MPKHSAGPPRSANDRGASWRQAPTAPQDARAHRSTKPPPSHQATEEPIEWDMEFAVDGDLLDIDEAGGLMAALNASDEDDEVLRQQMLHFRERHEAHHSELSGGTEGAFPQQAANSGFDSQPAGNHLASLKAMGIHVTGETTNLDTKSNSTMISSSSDGAAKMIGAEELEASMGAEPQPPSAPEPETGAYAALFGDDGLRGSVLQTAFTDNRPVLQPSSTAHIASRATTTECASSSAVGARQDTPPTTSGLSALLKKVEDIDTCNDTATTEPPPTRSRRAVESILGQPSSNDSGPSAAANASPTKQLPAALQALMRPKSATTREQRSGSQDLLARVRGTPVKSLRPARVNTPAAATDSAPPTTTSSSSAATSTSTGAMPEMLQKLFQAEAATRQSGSAAHGSAELGMQRSQLPTFVASTQSSGTAGTAATTASSTITAGSEVQLAPSVAWLFQAHPNGPRPGVHGASSPTFAPAVGHAWSGQMRTAAIRPGFHPMYQQYSVQPMYSQQPAAGRPMGYPGPQASYMPSQAPYMPRAHTPFMPTSSASHGGSGHLYPAQPPPRGPSARQ